MKWAREISKFLLEKFCVEFPGSCFLPNWHSENSWHFFFFSPPSLNIFLSIFFFVHTKKNSSQATDKYFNYDASTKKLFIFVAFKRFTPLIFFLFLLLASYKFKEINASWFSSSFDFKFQRAAIWSVKCFFFLRSLSFASLRRWSFPGTPRKRAGTWSPSQIEPSTKSTALICFC